MLKKNHRSMTGRHTVRAFGYRLRRLRPFHLRVLEDIDSPVMCNAVPPLEDVIVAAQLCSIDDPQLLAKKVDAPVHWWERWSMWLRAFYFRRRRCREAAVFIVWLRQARGEIHG